MNHQMTGRVLGLMVAGLLIGGPVAAQDPFEQPDRSWISIDGSVEEVAPNAFTLNYGEGLITVEMDDGDRDADAYKLLPGDMVSVSGMIDDDFLEARTIEASSVYVESLGTYFYASSLDDEDFFVTVTEPVVAARTVLQGTVTEVSDEEFVIATGLRRITVEVEEMSYNPLDDEGYQKIEVGDYVSVTGTIDDDLFEGRELVAEYVTTLRHAET